MSEVHCPRPSLSSSEYEYSYFLPPTPPPTAPQKSATRRPSIAVAMNWITHKSNNSLSSLASFTSSRNTSNSSIPSHVSHSPPLRISEPVLTSPLDDLSLQPRKKSQGRTLGQGAEIIGAPYEALERVGPRRDLPPIPASPNEGPITPTPISLRISKSSPHLPSSPLRNESRRSPPMPSVPLPGSSTSGVRPQIVVPPYTPASTPPESSLPLPNDPATSLPSIHTTAPTPSTYSAVPPPAPRPAFDPILIASPHSIPSHIEPSQIIVTLETSTASCRTTLATLLSRPSTLAEYLRSEVMGEADEDSSEKAPSPFTRAFSEHLSSEVMGAHQGVSNRIHIFLDRPSAPYSHILTYLRSPSDSVASLPRVVQFGAAPLSSSITLTKLDAIFELRDEAVYLGLEELVALCEVELKSWYGMKRDTVHALAPAQPQNTHRRGRSGGSPGSHPPVSARISHFRTESQPNVTSPPMTSSGYIPIRAPAAINTAAAKRAQTMDSGANASDEDDHFVTIMPSLNSPAPSAGVESGHTTGRSRSSSRSDVPPTRPSHPYGATAPPVRPLVVRSSAMSPGIRSANWI